MVTRDLRATLLILQWYFKCSEKEAIAEFGDAGPSKRAGMKSAFPSPPSPFPSLTPAHSTTIPIPFPPSGAAWKSTGYPTHPTAPRQTAVQAAYAPASRGKAWHGMRLLSEPMHSQHGGVAQGGLGVHASRGEAGRERGRKSRKGVSGLNLYLKLLVTRRLRNRRTNGP